MYRAILSTLSTKTSADDISEVIPSLLCYS